MDNNIPPLHSTSPPPLRVWVAVAIILLGACVLAIPLFLNYRSGIEKDFRNLCTDRIKDFTTRCETVRSPAPRIIALGGSLLICALRRDEEMEKSAQRAGCGETRFISLVRTQSNIEHFLPIMGRVIDARPDILLIDSDIIAYRFKPVDVSTFLEEYAAFCRIRMKELFKLFDERQGDSQNNRALKTMLGTDFLNSRITRTTGLLKSYREVIMRREPRGVISQSDPVLCLLKQACNLGIQVVILDLPRSRQADVVIPASHRQKEQELRCQLEQEAGVMFLDFPFRIPLEMFRDYSHLSGEGAKHYSSWLIPQMAKMVDKKVRR